MYFVPARRSPLKGDGPIASADDRFAMLTAATRDEPRFRVSRAELDREGPSFTVDTLAAMRDEGELFLILGSDAYADFDKWREPERIRGIATIVLAARLAYRITVASGCWTPRSWTSLARAHVGPRAEVRCATCRGATLDTSRSTAFHDRSRTDHGGRCGRCGGDKKAEDILVLNVSDLRRSRISWHCTGRGERQVQGIADAVREKATLAGRKPIGIEGYNSGRWVLIDLGDVVVHAFVPEERQLYRLERLWGDAPVVLRIA